MDRGDKIAWSAVIIISAAQLLGFTPQVFLGFISFLFHMSPTTLEAEFEVRYFEFGAAATTFVGMIFAVFGLAHTKLANFAKPPNQPYRRFLANMLFEEIVGLTMIWSVLA